MVNPNIPEDRPSPLANLVVEVAKLQGPAVGIVTALITGGAIGLSTGHIIQALLGLVPGVLALVGTIWGASHVATAGAPLVTPTEDPQNNAGEPLVPAAVAAAASAIVDPLGAPTAPDAPPKPPIVQMPKGFPFSTGQGS